MKMSKKLWIVFILRLLQKRKKNFKAKLRKEFFKNLLRGYSAFTKDAFEDSKSTDVYHYFDKEI